MALTGLVVHACLAMTHSSEPEAKPRMGVVEISRMSFLFEAEGPPTPTEQEKERLRSRYRELTARWKAIRDPSERSGILRERSTVGRELAAIPSISTAEKITRERRALAVVHHHLDAAIRRVKDSKRLDRVISRSEGALYVRVPISEDGEERSDITDEVIAEFRRTPILP